LRSRLYGKQVERVMSIMPFLAGQAFEPEIIRDMSTVYATVCSRLGLTRIPSAKSTETVAKTIIELAQRGVRNTEMLRKMTLAEFNIIE
jgi:hypothetical protein